MYYFMCASARHSSPTLCLFCAITAPTIIVLVPPPAPAAVVRHQTHLAYERLPVTSHRPANLGHPALAAAAFDAPQFISGTVMLRARAMKDAESTHNSTQVFVVVACQPRALQVRAVEAQQHAVVQSCLTRFVVFVPHSFSRSFCCIRATHTQPLTLFLVLCHIHAHSPVCCIRATFIHSLTHLLVLLQCASLTHSHALLLHVPAAASAPAHARTQVDIAGQSYLLSPGDHFFVPLGTTYTLLNHSDTTEAQVAFTVIKPRVTEAPTEASSSVAAGSPASSASS